MDGLRSEYAEGMEYRNAIGTAHFTRREREQAQEEEAAPARALQRGESLARAFMSDATGNLHAAPGSHLA